MATLLVAAAGLAAIVVTSSAINASYETDQICTVDNQIEVLQAKYDEMESQWQDIEMDQDVFNNQLKNDNQMLNNDVRDTQKIILSTQSKLRRQKIILSMVSFIIVLIVGLSLFLKLLLKKQNETPQKNIKLKDVLKIS
jgi:hypothetical protein